MKKIFQVKNLVISPHPNEKFEFWENYINKKKFKNIFINKDIHSSSYSLINSSEMLISCNSTSLLEAFFLEKKVINLLGKKRRVSEIELLKKITNVVRSSDELTETIKDLEQTENKKILHQEVREIKNFEENFDSFKEILDKLDELENVDSYDSLFKNNYYFVISQFRKYKNYIKWIISSIINKNAQHHRFHKSKIGSRLKKFFFINNTKHINSLEKIENLKIKQIAHEVFLLDSLNKY